MEEMENKKRGKDFSPPTKVKKKQRIKTGAFEKKKAEIKTNFYLFLLLLLIIILLKS